MKKSACLFSFLLAFLLTSSALFALEVPKRAEGYVTDRAGILSYPVRAHLEDTLRAYEEKTSNQVVVVTLPSLEGNSIEDFSIRLAQAWRVGQKGRDNGVIFLIFKNDRKIRIEVGYGLEGVLPDALGGQIIRDVVAPYFRKGDYSGGIVAGTDAIMAATQGEFKGVSNKGREGSAARLMGILLVFIVFHAWASSQSRRVGGRGRRGGRWSSSS